MASKEIRAALRAKFPVSEVKSRQGAGKMKLDYVAGETVIQRLLDATADEETGYAWQAGIFKADQTEDGKWAAVVIGNLIIGGDQGTGVGAMVNADLDMAVKSANTEAIKNAAKNGFGVALELWDKEYRDGLGQQRRAVAGDEQAMKQMVFDIAKKRLGGKPDSAAIAELFDITVGDLADPEALQTILKSEGVL